MHEAKPRVDDAGQRKRRQEPRALAGETLARPRDPALGRVRKPCGLFEARRGAIMVSRHRFDGALTDDLEAFVGVGVVAHQVTRRDDLVDPRSVDRLEHRGERLEVRMNVGEDGVSHGTSRPRSFVRSSTSISTVS